MVVPEQQRAFNTNGHWDMRFLSLVMVVSGVDTDVLGESRGVGEPG